jgi:membrane associated rhomboid family serine protease
MSYEFQPSQESEPPQISAEEYLYLQKRAIRRKSWWAVGIGGFIVAVYLGWLLLFLLLGLRPDFGVLFRSITFIIALLALVGGAYGLYYARNLKLEDLIPTEEAISYLIEGQNTSAYYSFILVCSLVAVTVAQLRTENVESWLLIGNESGQLLGLVKPKVWEGEWWRILTSATLHGIFPLHLYFNAQALYGLGSLIEKLANRAHLPIVFLLSVIGGGLFSTLFMPEIISIGASGGIMGLIGYMAIFGYKRKRQLPPGFLRTMMLNIAFIGLFGLVAYQFVDNFAHLGGLLTGALYGLVQIPSRVEANPRRSSFAAEILGALAIAIFIGSAIFTILTLTGTYALF